MNALVFGGTKFIGRAVVGRLFADGAEVTLVHRGVTNPGLFPQAREVLVDRKTLGRDSIPGGPWDVVFDFCAYSPSDVERAFGAVGDRAARWIHVSTGSVYASLEPSPIREDAALLGCTADEARATGLEAYGERKAECERVLGRLAARAGVPVFVGRPGVVYGPHDPTTRMTHWIGAVRSGRVTIPGDGSSVLHDIFVEDLAAALVAMTRADVAHAGAYNLATPEPHSLGALVDTIANVLGVSPERSFVAPEAAGDVPLFPGETDFILDVSRATEALGLVATPLADALRATIESLR